MGKAWAVMRRSVWASTILLVVGYLFMYFASNMVLFDSASAQTKPMLKFEVSRAQEAGSPPLRIFMYDLPEKFTTGVIKAYARSRGLSSDPKRMSYPGNQHSAEWWLYQDLQFSKPSSTRVRVSKPEEADVFYVPFFSSLSLVAANGKAEDGESAYDDEEMQEQLMAWLENQEPWKKNGGRDHVIICQDPNALHKLRNRLRNSVLLLSDFGRFKPEQASLLKDVVLPYTHRISSYTDENSSLERKTLLFFMGNRYRKEGGKIRDQLFQVLDNEKDMIIKHGTQSRENRREASMGMKTSKFCLHPAGDTPSACRLFDAIVSRCIPVVVSDEIELPFEDQLDYSDFSVFVPSSKALEPGYLGSLLRKISDSEMEHKRQRLREVRKYFEYDGGETVDMIWQQVAKKLPLIRTMINRDRRRRVADGSNCPCLCDGKTL